MAAAVNELKDVAEQDVALALAVVGTGTGVSKAIGGHFLGYGGRGYA